MALTMTGTGFDRLVNTILNDPGLKANVSAANIQTAAAAANTMNGYLVEAIKETGVAWDKTISAADLQDVNRYLEDNYQWAWADAHGNDEGTTETGFHLVQDDGATSRLFGHNAIDEVADQIYHLGFEVKWGWLMNEDGDWNASLKSVASYMNQLLASDLANTTKFKTFDAYAHATSGTGLDKLVNTIIKDPGLNNEIATSHITAGAKAADGMNGIIVDAIKATGVAFDGTLNKADVRELNAWIQDHKSVEWTDLHGDDDGDYESGYHLVQDDGATTKLFNQNGVDTVGDGIYHLGFDIKDGYFMNEDGNQNASVTAVTSWLNQLLKTDLTGSLKGTTDPYAHADTKTGLDQLVNFIIKDPGLNNNVATHEITAGAECADQMNAYIIEAIRKTGVANDKAFSTTDMVTLNTYIQSKHGDVWADLHGNDEDSYEYGFHLVKGDGASTKFLGVNAVNTVADGVYNIGFDLDGTNTKFCNEDGNATTTTTQVASYLTELLRADLDAGTLRSDYIA